MSRWTDGLPPYEALLERCVGLCRDEMLGEEYLESGMRAALAEVMRTLETVTPEQLSWAQGYANGTHIWHGMLHASPLEPPK